MTHARIVIPELLDSLPESAPAARRSRRDLRIINRLMGNGGWFERVLTRRAVPPGPLLEIGAGDGTLGARLARSKPKATAQTQPLSITGLDLVTRPENWPPQARWLRGSVFDFEDWHAYPTVLGNLVFHHFRDDELARIGAQLNRHARLVVINEPLRSAGALRWFSMLCPLIGADDVTRHDGRISIQAGFRGDELPALLGLDATRWRWRVEEAALGAYRLIAERRGA